MDGVIFFFPFEESWIVWLQHLGAGTALHTVLMALNHFFSFLGEEIICIAIIGIVYWGFDKQKGERICYAMLLANVLIGMLKNVFSRIRPWMASDRIELYREVDGFSFPSGHSANCTSLYPTTAMEYKEKRWLTWAAICIPLLCGISRCFVGAHWPTDVLVGWLTGIGVFLIVEFAAAKLKNKYGFYLALIALSACGMFYCRTNDYFNAFGMLVGATLGLKYEETFVHFENTGNFGLALLRTVVGGALYFGISTLVKLMVGGLFPAASFGWFLMRSLRYAIVMFVLVGIYPYAFRLEKLLKKSGKKAA